MNNEIASCFGPCKANGTLAFECIPDCRFWGKNKQYAEKLTIKQHEPYLRFYVKELTDYVWGGLKWAVWDRATNKPAPSTFTYFFKFDAQDRCNRLNTEEEALKLPPFDK